MTLVSNFDLELHNAMEERFWLKQSSYSWLKLDVYGSLVLSNSVTMDLHCLCVLDMHICVSAIAWILA